MNYIKWCSAGVSFALICFVLLLCPFAGLAVDGEEKQKWKAEFNAWDGMRKEWTQPKTADNGIPFPTNYRDWKVISVSHRLDRSSVRCIVGNDIAVKAAREKKTNPWPEGTMLIKVPWRERRLTKGQDSFVPGELMAVAVMFKDSKKFASTLGWGFAIWHGIALQLPEDQEASVARCVSCHSFLEKRDYVFTVPAILP